MKAIARRPRMWDAEVPTTAVVEGGLSDWPAEMQDQVYAALEEIIVRTGVKELEIVQAISWEEGGLPRVRVTVMEKLGPEDVVIIH